MEQKKIVILGGGESGFGAAVLAKEKGYSVFLSDSGIISDKYKAKLEYEGIEYESGIHTEAKILEAAEVIKSPGIPEKSPIIKKLRAQNTPIISEIEFAYRYQKGKIVGITGSNGKTTTTNLLYHVFKQSGLNAGMAGNVGNSFAYMVARDPKDIYVLEISSFQLDDIKKFRCDVAILLNITPDHLDRYEYQMRNYVGSKFRITENQTENDVFIYCKDDKETVKFMNEKSKQIIAEKIPFSLKNKLDFGGFLDDEDRLIINTHQPVFEMHASELTIKGKHNQYNSLAAGIAARYFEIKNEKIRNAFQTFESIPHRMEKVLTIGGVEYINDSKATNVNSTWYALESLEKKGVWIVGGVDKGNDYTPLHPLVKDKIKAIVCLGTDNLRLNQEFKHLVRTIINVDNMRDAVRSASMLAERGDCVILSPCCASFDLFKNYEDRGNQFKDFVKEL